MSYIEIKNLYKVYNEKTLAIDDFNLNIEKNEFVALIGPSGCGKSTILRMVSGLEDITSGELIIDGKLMNDLHAKDRDMSMVFQNYALYPHLTNYNNIAFGLQLRKINKNEIDKRVNEVAKILDLTDYLQRYPSELSGGQRQRVALGRAMVQNSHIFLMDEPLSNLDAKLRNRMRVEILKLHKALGVTTLYVTHDQVEAMTMADKIVVMNSGVIQQIGTPRELYYDPQNLFVAKFIGDPDINILDGSLIDNDLVIASQKIKLKPELYKKLEQYNNKQVKIGIRSEDIVPSEHSDSNECYSGLISLVEMRGDNSIVFTNFENQEIILKTNSNKILEIDKSITYHFNTDKILLFDPITEERI